MAEVRRSNFNDNDLRGRLRRPVYRSERRIIRPGLAPAKINDFRPSIARMPDNQDTRNSRAASIPNPLTISSSDFTTLSKGASNQSERIETAPTTIPALSRQRPSHVLQRQQAAQKPKSIRKRAIGLSTAALWSMAGIIFLAGIVVSLVSLRTNHTARAQVAQLANKNAGDDEENEVPSEDPPKDSLNNYQVASDLPRFISIPKYNVKSRVLRMGVKSNNELKAPNNIFDSGWYDGSAKPGEKGAVLIDGHVRGPTKPGVFYNLKNLSTGDVIEITRGDGQIIKYKAVKSKLYTASQTDMVAALKPIEGERGLNLITCAGKFNREQNNYEDRLVVFAVQIE